MRGDKKRKATSVHTFPLQIDESVRFETSGAFVDKATLIVGGRTLSVIRPHYDDDTVDPPPARMLAFFRDVPLHAALMNGVPAQVTLEVSDGRLPSLTFHVLRDSLTWPKLGSTVYREEVYASCDEGEVLKVLLYVMNGGVGYVRGVRPGASGSTDGNRVGADKPSTNN
jgi:hypothetical protein